MQEVRQDLHVSEKHKVSDDIIEIKANGPFGTGKWVLISPEGHYWSGDDPLALAYTANGIPPFPRIEPPAGLPLQQEASREE